MSPLVQADAPETMLYDEQRHAVVILLSVPHLVPREEDR
jgi:hypothetical protein